MTDTPPVYPAVRAVGTFKPKFTPSSSKIFADELNVIGTAFWLKDQKVLVTCAHVVVNLFGPLEVAGLLVVGKAGNYRRATIGAIDIQHDLALLTLLDNNSQPIAGVELEAEATDGLQVVTEYPSIATQVAYAGFPLGNQLLNQTHSPTYAEGVVGIEKRVTPARKEIQISGAVIGGFSGSPVVTKTDSKLIGVISNGPMPNDRSGNIFMAVSWEHVTALANLGNT